MQVFGSTGSRYMQLQSIAKTLKNNVAHSGNFHVFAFSKNSVICCLE